MPNGRPATSGSSKPLLMVIDGHALVHRAYHAIAVRAALNVSKTGEPTTAVYGFVNMLLKAFQDVKPTHWVISFDRPKPTFRHEQYKDYKAGRAAAPEELRSQFGRVRQVVEAFGMPILEMDGFEADDVIGTLCRKAEARGVDTVILTGDTDTLQLVSPRVRVRLQRGVQDLIIYDVDKVRERYGLEPAQMADFKALKGDPSDNIPSVPGVGEKTAVKLLQQFGAIEGIYKDIEHVEPAKLRDLMKAHEESLRKNKMLVTIVTDMPVDLDMDKARIGHLDRPRVVELFRELEFNSLIGKIPESLGPSQAPLQPSLMPVEEVKDTDKLYKVVDTGEALDEMVAVLRAAGQFALDVEASDSEPMRADLVGIAFSTVPGKAYYVPLGHVSGRQLPLGLAVEKLKALLEDSAVGKVAHNGKQDIILLANNGVKLSGLKADVVVAAYLLGAKALTVRALAFERFSVELPSLSSLVGSASKQISLAKVPIEQVSEYACANADMAGRLWPLLEADLGQRSLTRLLADLELPLVPVLARIEMNGVALDTELLAQMSREMEARLGQLEAAIYDSVGHQFNINSPSQLSDILFAELNLPKSKRTKSGFSTDAQVLEGLKGAHPMIDSLLEYRQLSKLKSTYIDALPQLVNPKTRRLHTSFNQVVAATGRLSSSDPNLQNIPIRTDLGKRVRQAFVAEKAPDWLLISADYSQIELRILAHITQDPNLLGAFARDEDIHAATASQVYGVPLDKVTPDMRRFAKVVNFGILYGMSDYGLAVRSELSRKEAAPIIEQYFAKYPGIQKYLDETKQQAKKKGYAETLLGRRRYIPELNAANAQVRSAGERMAINMPIQGTAADIIKLAMVRMQVRLDRLNLRSKMILQVHDELLFEVPKDESDTVKSLAREIMPGAMQLSVPLKIDLKAATRWGDMY